MEAMKDLTPEMALTKQYEEEAEKARLAADKYRDDVLLKVSAQLEESKAAKKAQAEAKKKEMEDALRWVVRRIVFNCCFSPDVIFNVSF